MPATSLKRRTNVTIDSETLDAARDLGLNVSAISEAAVLAAVRQARAEQWRSENAAALAERRVWADRNNLPLASVQVLKHD